MKPNELYEMEPEREYMLEEPYDVLVGCYYNHVPELHVLDVYSPGQFDPSQCIKIKELKHFNFDFRRYWRLATVWMNTTPVMIIRNAGREGDDFADRFVTNSLAYSVMVTHLFKLYRLKPDSTKDLVDPDDDISDLTKFYGNQLDGYFERHNPFIW